MPTKMLYEKRNYMELDEQHNINRTTKAASTICMQRKSPINKSPSQAKVRRWLYTGAVCNKSITRCCKWCTYRKQTVVQFADLQLQSIACCITVLQECVVWIEKREEKWGGKLVCEHRQIQTYSMVSRNHIGRHHGYLCAKLLTIWKLSFNTKCVFVIRQNFCCRRQNCVVWISMGLFLQFFYDRSFEEEKKQRISDILLNNNQCSRIICSTFDEFSCNNIDMYTCTQYYTVYVNINWTSIYSSQH